MKPILAALLTLAFVTPGLAGKMVLGPNLTYSIHGEEAVELYESMTKATGAFESEDGTRDIIRMDYDRAGAANIRIRTKVICKLAQQECTVEVTHLTFVPHRGN